MSCTILLGGADTSDVTALAANVDSGKKFIDADGNLITGTSNKLYTQAQYDAYGTSRYNAGYNAGYRRYQEEHPPERARVKIQAGFCTYNGEHYYTWNFQALVQSGSASAYNTYGSHSSPSISYEGLSISFSNDSGASYDPWVACYAHITSSKYFAVTGYENATSGQTKSTRIRVGTIYYYSSTSSQEWVTFYVTLYG